MPPVSCPDGVHLLQMRCLPLRTLERSGCLFFGGDMPAGHIDQAVALGHGPLHPPPRAVLVAEAVFHAHGWRAQREPGAAGDGIRRIVGMTQIAHMHGFEFIFAPAEQSRPCRIQAEQITFEIGDCEQVFRDVPNSIALQRALFNFRLQPLADRAQLGFHAGARLVRQHALDGEAKLTRQRQSQIDVFAAEFARRVVIRHEFADQPAFGHQRNESQRADAFSFHSAADQGIEFDDGSIGQTDRLGIGFACRPRRMAFDGAAIAIRQAAPSGKAHDPGQVVTQDRRPAAMQRRGDRIQSRIVDFRQGG